MQNKIVMVVAPCFAEYKRYINAVLTASKKPAYDIDSEGRAVIDGMEYHYVTSSEMLRGSYADQIQFIGAWHERVDSKEMHKIAMERQML